MKLNNEQYKIFGEILDSKELTAKQLVEICFYYLFRKDKIVKLISERQKGKTIRASYNSI